MTALNSNEHDLTLNSFQQMMLKWNTLTPYNAGHVIHLSGKPDITRWEKMVLTTIQELKLGLPQFFQNEQRVKFIPIESLKIETPLLDLDSHIANELNRPFSKNDFPIRFFILQQNESYYFGAIYNHWISDSYAMRALFQRIFQRYQTHETELPALTLEAPSFRSLFKKYMGLFPWLDGVKEFIKCMLHFQSAYRMKLQDPLNFHVNFNRYYLPEGLITDLSQFSKHHQASLNDVFLSALAKTLGQHTQLERANKKRKKMRLFARNRLVLGTIVDVRHHAHDKLQNVFGQYLSNFTIILNKPEETPTTRLLQKITSQTQKIKNSFRTIKNFASWDLSLFSWKFLSSPKSQARFFNKNAPVLAGISNVNLTHSWVGEHPGKVILDYLRISPTGVLLPLVFTLTTLHNRLSLCVTYRTTAFSNTEVDLLCKSFIEQLTNYVKTQKKTD